MEPPISYLTLWRLNRAAHWLRRGDLKVLEVASRVGYDSEVALSRAFKRCFGISPGAYRRRHSVASDALPGSMHGLEAHPASWTTVAPGPLQLDAPETP